MTLMLDELRARHPATWDAFGEVLVCARCRDPHPCDAMLLGSALTAAESQIGRLEAALKRARMGRAKYRSELARARERAAALEARLKGTG